MWDWNTHCKPKPTHFRSNSNCTNVGLKSRACCWVSSCNCILIAPMWDWNALNFTLNNKVKVFILIAPMWDWNFLFCIKHCLVKNILIAPMWDWNFLDLIVRVICRMILIAPMWDWNKPWKPESLAKACILIAPMWDWNRSPKAQANYHLSF